LRPARRALLVVAALTGLAALPNLAAAAPVPPTAEAAACPAYRFIAARGSGEPPGMGALLKHEYEGIRGTLGDRAGLVDKVAVDYPAQKLLRDYTVLGKTFHGLPDHQSYRYFNSMLKGRDRIVELAKKCSGSRIILAGFSQGAHAIMEALPRIARNKVLAVTLFGNPEFKASYGSQGDFDVGRTGIATTPRTSFPGDLKGRLYDYCHGRDPICQGFVQCRLLSTVCYPNFDFGRHNYDDSSEMWSAVANVARLIRDDQGSRGNPLPEPAPVAKGPVDVVFSIDTTGSMEPIISEVASNVQAMAGQLATASPDFRLALVTYRDGPPYCDDEYQAVTVQDFTTDTGTFNAAVDSLIADGGCDEDESVYTGAMQGLGLAWRPGATHVMIMAGDAPGHDPDPVTGFTAEDVIARANAIPAFVYGLDGGFADSFYALADGTGGQVYSVSDYGEVPVAIAQAIASQASAPTATITCVCGARRTATAAQEPGEYSGPVGAPIRLSAASSWSPLGRALAYGWDWDSDGTVDETTDAPIISHTWTAPFDGEVTLRVTDSAGRSAITRAHVVASGAPLAAPARPSRPKLRLRGRTARATWRAGTGGGPPAAWVVRSNRGAVIGYLNVRHGKQAFTVRRLPKKRAFRVTVSALNAAGDSRRSRPSKTVTPGVRKRGSRRR
jgi:hypothetical protein